MKVLLLGANGMLGQAIARIFSRKDNVDLICVARNYADYSFDLLEDVSVRQCFRNIMPNVVVNAAGLVNLDDCERYPADAYLVNGRLCSILADLCQEIGCYFIQISTDHYYTGDGLKKHTETDSVTLVNEYARSKYIGECLTLLHPEFLVIRTNIVGFRRDKNRPTFVEWVLKSITQQCQMQLFDDFYTSSLHTWQFAEYLYCLLNIRPSGILNVASSEVFSKKDFILCLAKTLCNKIPKYNITSIKNSLTVRRAESLGLSTEKIEDILCCKMPTMEEVLCSLKEEYQRQC